MTGDKDQELHSALRTPWVPIEPNCPGDDSTRGNRIQWLRRLQTDMQSQLPLCPSGVPESCERGERHLAAYVAVIPRH